MNQSETKKQKFITNILNIYKEIGIDITISNESFYKEPILYKENENYNTHKNKELKIKELENSFENFEGCKLKKTSTNFVKFYGNTNSKLLIIDGPPDVDEDKKGVSFVSSKSYYLKKCLML